MDALAAAGVDADAANKKGLTAAEVAAPLTLGRVVCTSGGHVRGLT